MSELDDVESGNYHYSMKLVVVGDAGVGKTTLLSSHVRDEAQADGSAEPEPGYCTDFMVKGYERGGCKYLVQFWDVAGVDVVSESASVARLCAGGAGGVVVFDCSTPASFERLPAWLAATRQSCVGGAGGSGSWALVGNSTAGAAAGADAVSQAQAEAFAEENGMRYYTDFNSAVYDVLSCVGACIPSPPEPSLLLRQGVAVGRMLAQDPSFRRAVFG